MLLVSLQKTFCGIKDDKIIICILCIQDLYSTCTCSLTADIVLLIYECMGCFTLYNPEPEINQKSWTFIWSVCFSIYHPFVFGSNKSPERKRFYDLSRDTERERVMVIYIKKAVFIFISFILHKHQQCCSDACINESFFSLEREKSTSLPICVHMTDILLFYLFIFNITF